MNMSHKPQHVTQRRRIRSLFLAAMVCTALPGTLASAQTASASQSYQGCVEKKVGYTCDISGFRRTLASAQAIAVRASSRDRVAQNQLKELILSLGKSISEEGSPADLTVQIVPADGSGVSFGPAGTDLATLRFYEGTPGPTGKLLWIETYNGQRDVPWPAIVHSVIAQFQSTLRKSPTP